MIANATPGAYEYMGSFFTVQVCFGGFSCTIWLGDSHDQSKELGLYDTPGECVTACVKWIDRRMAAQSEGRV